MTISSDATHTRDGEYFRKAKGSAYIWCKERRMWRYLEDRTARILLKQARELSTDNREYTQ